MSSSKCPPGNANGPLGDGRCQQRKSMWENLSTCALIFSGSSSKVPQTEWLKQLKCIVSGVWRRKYKTEICAGLVASEGESEALFQAHPRLWWFSGNLCHSLASATPPASLPSSLHGVFPVSLPSFLFL